MDIPTKSTKLFTKLKKIMHSPEIHISATCVRVPVLVGHCESVHVQFANPLTTTRARTLLQFFPGVRVIDDLESLPVPNPNNGFGFGRCVSRQD